MTDSKVTYKRVKNDDQWQPYTYTATIGGVVYKIEKQVSIGNMYEQRGAVSYEAFADGHPIGSGHTLALAKHAVDTHAAEQTAPVAEGMVLRIEDDDGFATEWPWPEGAVALGNSVAVGICEYVHDQLRPDTET